MDELIYLVCTRLQKQSGGCDYDPAIDPASSDNIQMLACDNLVKLQTENEEAIDALREIADVVIIPVSLQTYTELDRSLRNVIKDVDEKLDEAAIKMADAYKIMGITVDVKELKERMMTQTTICGSAGKVLNEELQIVDRASDYVTADTSDDYYDDYEDEDEDDFDDDYEDEDEDDEGHEDEDEDEDFDDDSDCLGEDIDEY